MEKEGERGKSEMKCRFCASDRAKITEAEAEAEAEKGNRKSAAGEGGRGENFPPFPLSPDARLAWGRGIDGAKMFGASFDRVHSSECESTTSRSIS